jgi:hypothetical protein
MILVTHGIIGAAVGRLFPDKPIISFIAGFISHFLFDAVPHWHYRVFSQKKDPMDPMNNDMQFGWKFVMDLVDIGIDCAAGIALPILLFQGWGGFSNISPAVLWGAIGAIIPDFFQFVHMKWRRGPFARLQYFHLWIHSRAEIDDLHFIGIASQTAIIIAVVLLSRAIF